MTYSELVRKVDGGEIILPIVATIKKPLWEEFELDAGCKALLTGIEYTGDGSEVKVCFDFNEFIEYNKVFWKRDYYDTNGVPCLAIYETSGWERLEGRCDCYVTGQDDVQFSTKTPHSFVSDTMRTSVLVPEELVGKKFRVTFTEME